MAVIMHVRIFAALSVDDEDEEVWSEVVFVDSNPHLEVHIVLLPAQVYNTYCN